MRYLLGSLLGIIGLYIIASMAKVLTYYTLDEWYNPAVFVEMAVVGIACIWQACRLFRKPKRKVRRVSHEND